MADPSRWFAIKAEIRDLSAATYVFAAQKTMYGGKTIAIGDSIFLFASENEGGAGLFARGVVSHSDAVPRSATAHRWTPRVSIQIERKATARHPLCRSDLRRFRGEAGDGPDAELDFKLYRQATNKIVGLSDRTAAFLNGLF